MKYSVGHQIRTMKLIRRVVDVRIVGNEGFAFGLTRWFGTIFFGLMGSWCLIFGLAGLISGR